MLRVNDEEAEQAQHLRHRHVRVVEERAVLVQRELVGEALAGADERLADRGDAIHLDRHLDAVPVDCRRLREAVLEQDADTVTLRDLDRGSRVASVVPPHVHDPAGDELRLHRFRDEPEHLDAVVQLPRQLRHVEDGHGHRRAGAAGPRCGRARARAVALGRAVIEDFVRPDDHHRTFFTEPVAAGALEIDRSRQLAFIEFAPDRGDHIVRAGCLAAAAGADRNAGARGFAGFQAKP